MNKKIHTLPELMAALESSAPASLEIQNSLLVPYPVTLPPGFSLTGRDPRQSILSFSSGDGLGLTSDNAVTNLTIQVTPASRAIYLASARTDLGTLTLSHLTVTGQIQLLTRTGTHKSKFVATQIDIVACDARSRPEQPQKYGVDVLQGAFTLYNFNSDPDSVIEATVTDLSLGRAGAPVLGSGLYLGGYGDTGGRVHASTITTGEIHSNGMISEGTADLITAGVFVANGASVEKLTNHGSVTTYGINDMVLDNWGKVNTWIAEKPLTSYGPSGIGFVNFGTVDSFEAKDSIETFGAGARGFNQYDGTVGKAKFASITTHADGSIGIQVSKPVGTVQVTGPIVTHGSVGQTLVKGVIMTLAADGVSVKAGGQIKELILSGGITTTGNNVTSLEVEGEITALSVTGQISASGSGSVGAAISAGGQVSLDGISVVSEHGVPIQKGVS